MGLPTRSGVAARRRSGVGVSGAQRCVRDASRDPTHAHASHRTCAALARFTITRWGALRPRMACRHSGHVASARAHPPQKTWLHGSSSGQPPPHVSRHTPRSISLLQSDAVNADDIALPTKRRGSDAYTLWNRLNFAE
jgi:hypothetical protein